MPTVLAYAGAPTRFAVMSATILTGVPGRIRTAVRPNSLGPLLVFLGLWPPSLLLALSLDGEHVACRHVMRRSPAREAAPDSRTLRVWVRCLCSSAEVLEGFVALSRVAAGVGEVEGASSSKPPPTKPSPSPHAAASAASPHNRSSPRCCSWPPASARPAPGVPSPPATRPASPAGHGGGGPACATTSPTADTHQQPPPPRYLQPGRSATPQPARSTRNRPAATPGQAAQRPAPVSEPDVILKIRSPPQFCRYDTGSSVGNPIYVSEDLNPHGREISPDRGNHAIRVTGRGTRRVHPGITRRVRYLARYLACTWLGGSCGGAAPAPLHAKRPAPDERAVCGRRTALRAGRRVACFPSGRPCET